MRVTSIALWLALALGCGGPPPKVAPPAVVEVVARPAPPAEKPAAPLPTVVVRVSGAASRRPERPRVLRRLLAERAGRLELAHGYTRVSLIVTAIVEGTLDDPDYAKRPIGANRLPVVLLDEAAFAAPDSLDGFEGTWTLTRRPDGILVVSAIEHTPFVRATKGAGAAELGKTRVGLRGKTPEERADALRSVDVHRFYELAPAAIALLDDAEVASDARATMRSLVLPLAGDDTPDSTDRAEWQTYWDALVSRDEPEPRLATSTRSELAELAMNQGGPALAAAGDTVVASIGALAKPRADAAGGLALWAPFGDGSSPRFIASEAEDALDVAISSSGVGVLSAGFDGRFHLTLPAANAPKRVDLPNVKASHGALAARAKTGFVYAYVTKDHAELFAQALDASGKPEGAARPLQLPSTAIVRYKRGVHPLSAAKHDRGWFIAVETDVGVVLVNATTQLGLSGAYVISDPTSGAEPTLAAVGERAFVVWKGGAATSRVAFALLDASGHPLAVAGSVGTEVERIARPIVLDDGTFVVAWIESEEELHVARFSAAGALLSTAPLQVRDVAPFALALGRDAQGLFVVYEETGRFPYPLVVRRFPATGW